LWIQNQFARLTQVAIEHHLAQQSVSQIIADERRAMAQDLHDDPIQAITAVSLRIQRLLASATPEQREQLVEVQSAVSDAIERMRSMLFELHPPTLDDEGLVSAVELYLYERLDPLGIDWKLHDRVVDEPRSATASLAYRLAREALANVAHHSQASHVDVTIEQVNGGILTRIVDDGVGCDVDAAIKGRAGHLGTVSSRHLAKRASGWWTMTSTPGSGTTVEFWLPTGGLR
jgi:signal transduction histidine kinase